MRSGEFGHVTFNVSVWVNGLVTSVSNSTVSVHLATSPDTTLSLIFHALLANKSPSKEPDPPSVSSHQSLCSPTRYLLRKAFQQA